jgi:hypothetical protein
MPLFKYFNNRFLPAIYLTALLGIACKKDVNPDKLPGIPLGQITYLNISEDLRAQVSQAVRYSQYSYVLVDNEDTSYVLPGSGVGFPCFSQYSPLQYPVADGINSILDQPWIKYDLQARVDHRLILTDTGHRALVRMPVTVPPDTPVTVWFMDSLGSYQGIVTKDVFNHQDGKAGIRLVDASPDAGPVFFTINKEFAGGDPAQGIPATGFPDTLKYGNISPFIQRSVAVLDTLKLRFYSVADSTTVLIRSSLIIQPGHAYTVVLAGYNQSESYTSPRTGAPVSLSADLRIVLFKNN